MEEPLRGTRKEGREELLSKCGDSADILEVIFSFFV
jgi:hypothetical protein